MSAASCRVIDGVQIPERLISEEAQNHPAGTAEEARRAAGHALAIRALLLNRADILGLRPEPVIEEDGREETPEEALIRAVLEAEVVVQQPTEAEVRRVYDAGRHVFRSPTLTEASHILVAPEGEEPGAWETARERAEDLIRQLAEPNVRFADLARAHSDCTSAGIGGSLGQLSPGDLTASVEAGLAELAPGEISAEPVRSRFGWHILRLDRRIDGRDLPFEHVQDEIALQLEGRRWTADASRYVAGLVTQAREQGVAIVLTEDGRAEHGQLSLGDLLRDDLAVAARAQAWLLEADADLALQVQAAADREQLEFAAFVREQVRAFVNDADDEKWTQLISAAQGAGDPALGCIRAILKGQLQPAARTYTLIQRA
ncbi:MAG: peptidylprolyl isomerase [Caulobacterales bacterium]|nr:peptidylprolyl isomerase [Caulobacterales bacterium]